jgi:single-stranded-DNA-specific exonuclease
MKIVERSYSPSSAYALVKAGISPVLARVYAARGIKSLSEVSNSADFLPFSTLKDATTAADLLIDAIKTQRRVLIISDYDADGATACSIGIRGLTAYGANVGYLVPNRFDHGYGLTLEIVREAAVLEPKPSLIITVDNGISSHGGIDEANALGMDVLVTDHHLPGETLPNATLIVNPNRKDCTFASKSLAGCGVMWYILWALEEKLRASGVEPNEPGFTIESLLPLVALGTVADVVALDANNRALVRTGLDMIRTKPSFAGIEALAVIARRDARQLTTGDIAFGIGPRINAAGRLESMKTGIECLTTNDPVEALELAKRLDGINYTRREIEVKTVEEACEQVAAGVGPDQYTAVAYQENWHKGVVGIVAGRVRELVFRPTFIFASDSSGRFTGSGRSIIGFNLRDALDLVSKRESGLLLKYGGHAMAAGCTLRAGGLDAFVTHFEAVARSMLTPADLLQQIDTDGALEAQEMCIETVNQLRDEVWGQAFPEPTFTETFRVIDFKRIGEDKSHLKMTVVKGSKAFQAVKFRAGDQVPTAQIRAVFKLGANTFRGATTLQLLLDHFEPG